MSGALTDGEVIDGKYRIVRLIGRGAWGSVFEGVNTRIGRRVAIKVMSTEAMCRVGFAARFEREAQAATRVESEHVVHVFDLGVLADGRQYIVMELLEGENLAQQIAARGPLSERRAVFYAIQALRGLADAHAAGVLHRDIKPDNIVIVTTKQGDEVVKIVDFGISKVESTVQPTSMTQTNTVLGSPVYMSPEQCRGMRHMDHRSDLYSLGVVLFELLTKKLPHTAETFSALMFKIALEDADSPALARPDLDPDLCAIVTKALAREVNHRFQTAQEFERALTEWGERHGLAAGGTSSLRTKLWVDVAGDSESLRATTERPPALLPPPASGAEPEAPPRDPDPTATQLSAAAPLFPTMEAATRTGDPAMSVSSTPAPDSEDEQRLPSRKPLPAWVRAAAVVALLLAAFGLVARSRAWRREPDAAAGTAAAPHAAKATAPIATVRSDDIPDPPEVEPLPSGTSAPVAPATAVSVTRSAQKATPAPFRSAASSPTAPPMSVPKASARPTIGGRHIRTDF